MGKPCVEQTVWVRSWFVRYAITHPTRTATLVRQVSSEIVSYNQVTTSFMHFPDWHLTGFGAGQAKRAR